MKQRVTTPKNIRQRRFLLVLPVLAFPFLTMLFWALGGGQIAPVQAQATTKKGFNNQLPDAHLNDAMADKMSFYQQAQQDSIKLHDLMRNDPGYPYMPATDSAGNWPLQEPDTNTFRSPGLNGSLFDNGHSNDPHADRIYRKLSDLNRQLDYQEKSSSALSVEQQQATGLSHYSNPVNTADINRLEQMMQAMNQSGSEDAEMKQLDGMLEKVLDLQHPQRVQEKIRQQSALRRGQVFAVTTQQSATEVSVLEAPGTLLHNDTGFYAPIQYKEQPVHNAIRVLVHQTQTLVNGSTIKLRLAHDVMVNGIRIPKDNFIFGTVSLNGERLEINITGLRYEQSLFPVALTACDLDGLEGIYIPGAITRDVAKESADRSLQAVGLTTLDPSWGAQAAGAGIEAVKTLVSRKVKLVKVTVKAGYQLLLRDEKQKQHESN